LKKESIIILNHNHTLKSCPIGYTGESMTNKTHWKKLVNPDYIGAYCIEEDTVVKIVSVGQEEVKGENGKKDFCTVARLENMKPFIINRTNAKTITQIVGSPYIEDWVGHSITVYPTTTKVKGDVVECLRIRATAPQVVDYSQQAKQLRECKTLADLQTIYKSFTKDQQIGTVSVKDECKAQLS